VALVHRPKYGDWSLPKGKLRRGEHPLATTCREVAEETGVCAVAGRRLDIEHYDTASGPKAVEYWAMRGPDADFEPTAEVDRLAWLPLAEARRRLDYEHDTYAIDALEVLAASAVNGSAVLLVRNGRAVHIRRWEGSEADRPLDTEGQEQAEALRRTLPAFGPTRLLSARAARCADTMRPLGADLGLTVEPEPALGEDEYVLYPRRGVLRVLELAGAGPTTAVCAPGAVIGHLLAALADDADLALGEFRAGKGSVWALFFCGGQLTGGGLLPGSRQPAALMTMAAGTARKLVLLRHAKSAWPDVPDHERPLARRGQRDAPVMGRWLREAGHLPDQVLCSTASRARETWQLTGTELGASPPASFDGRLYQTSAGQLLDLIHHASPAVKSLLIVGHDPAIPELALMLAATAPSAPAGGGGGAGASAMLDRMRAKFPTAAVAVLEFTGGWDQLAPGSARLTSFMPPRDLRSQAQPGSKRK